MAANVPDQILDRVRTATDIVQLVRETVLLKKAGTGFVGLCPFHREKTGSFHVNPERQIFKCFGCGAGGDIFSFVMKTDNVSFPEAIRILAERAHVPLPERSYGGPDSSEKAKLYEVNAWAAELYNRCLEREFARPALEYLLGRGLTAETIKQFNLGYSPDAWDTLVKGAARRKFSVQTLTATGLLATSDRSDRMYDRFRNRVMFPIVDVQERVIGFGARSMDGSEPKYLNSPETPLFTKGRTVYGLDRAKGAIRERKQVLIVEGYMDAIMAHQFGITWTVGVLGTALTEDHVRLLKRFAEEAILLFDADNAGQSSANRSIDAFASQEMPVRVATIPDTKDPDEFLRAHGAEEFVELLARAVDGTQFKLERALASSGPGASALHMAKALDDVLATVGRMPNPVARTTEVRRIARRAGLTETAVEQRVRDLMVGVPARAEETEAPSVGPKARDPEVELLQAILEYPEAAGTVQAALHMELVRNPAARRLIERALEMNTGGAPCDAAALLTRTGEEPLRAVLEEVIGRESARVTEPAAWCRELIGEIEARAHDQTGQDQHRRVVAAGRGTDQDEALQRRLAALRDAQRARGKLHLKTESQGMN